MSSRSSTERLMNFSSESVASHLVFWVSSWVACFVSGWVLVFGCVVGFCLGRHLTFCSHLFSNMSELANKNNTFWWSSEPRARTAWAKKTMTPSHLHLKFPSAGMLWLFLAWMKTSFYLTCTLPEEQECCVSDLALTKNIGSTMKHGQQTEQKSLRRSSMWKYKWLGAIS